MCFWHPSDRASSLVATSCTCSRTGSVRVFLCQLTEPLTESPSSAECESATSFLSAVSNLSVEAVVKSEQCSLISLVKYGISTLANVLNTRDFKSFTLMSYELTQCQMFDPAPRRVFCFQSNIPQHLRGFKF